MSLKGEFLSPQLIYKGKTPACHPMLVKFPDRFHVTQTENHWSNGRVHPAYLKNTIISHIDKLPKQSNLTPGPDDLLIYDVYKGPNTGAVSELLEKTTLYRRRCQLTKSTFSNC